MARRNPPLRCPSDRSQPGSGTSRSHTHKLRLEREVSAEIRRHSCVQHAGNLCKKAKVQRQGNRASAVSGSPLTKSREARHVRGPDRVGAARGRPARQRIAGARSARCGTPGCRGGVLRDGERGGALHRLRRLPRAGGAAGGGRPASASTSGWTTTCAPSGLAGYVAIASATVREAMANAVRYGALRDTSAVYALEDGDGAGRVSGSTAAARTCAPAGTRPSSRRRWCSPPATAGSAPASGRSRCASRTRAAASRRAIERRFNCPVRFGAEVTEMVLSPEQLDLPVRGADPHLLALVTGHAEAALAERRRARGTATCGRGSSGWCSRALPKGTPTLAAGGGGARDRRADAGAAARRRGDAVPAGRRRAAARPWRTAISRTRSSAWRRSPTCSAMPSRAPSRARSGAGPGGRRGGFGWRDGRDRSRGRVARSVVCTTR